MNSYNVIGDIAGNYKTLMALLKKMPGGTPVSLGDMVDRGPRSKEVVEFFMANGHAIMGNHEHMFIEAIQRDRGELRFSEGAYDRMSWYHNGGGFTRDTYGGLENVPESHYEWLQNLPKFILVGDPAQFYLSHAPYYYYPEDSLYFIWNRAVPLKHPNGVLTIHGHNAGTEVVRFEDVNSLCIDTSRANKLTGIHLPSLEIFEQDYID